MSRDVLDDATRALRGEAETGPEPASATRMRIVGALHARRRRRLLVLRGGIAVLAVAIGSTAWAAATGRLPSLWAVPHLFLSQSNEAGETAPGTADRGASGVPASSEPAAPEVAPSEAQSAASEPTGQAPSGARAQVPVALPPRAQPETPRATGVAIAAISTTPVSTTPVPTTPVPTTPVSTTPVSTTPVSTTPVSTTPVSTTPVPTTPVSNTPISATPSATPGSVVPADTEADALYTRAHALHFQSHDHAAALTAWNSYLKAAPGGRFATLAHFNRAICLVHLGRTAEARRALQPFATGAFGGYRRTEAQSLLDAMGAAPP